MKNKIKACTSYFSKQEIILWSTSAFVIILSYFLFDRQNPLTLLASLIGITSLIFNAKANPIGQLLMIIFSIFYGIISYKLSYYGEMITYLGMTMPMACFALVAWIRNPYNGNHAEVKVNHLPALEYILMSILTAVITVLFFFILKYLSTANLIVSTISVATSFSAVYLTFRRSPYYAVGYAANDIVLIILWLSASTVCIRYISVTVCFIAFLANDIYGFINWRQIQIRQS